MTEQVEHQNNQWDGDVLDRKQYADFLTPYLVNRVRDEAGKAKRSFTVALDADWGEGKTFFIKRWAQDLDDLDVPHLTLIFDSWNEDYSADPLIAFLAAFEAALERGLQKLPPTTQAVQEAQHTLSNMVKGVRRAFLPTMKVVGKAFIAKAIGTGVDELYDAVKGDEGDRDLTEKAGDAGMEALNSGLDEYFDKLLEEQRGRGQIIAEFKTSIEKTLTELSEAGLFALPMFVFVDELDRCRPNFAITLLEAIKHLFGVPGVCFVVSTNMSQLSQSVKAVYGSGFDARGYLGRFFDVEYDLPAPDRLRYVELLLTEFPEITSRKLNLGLPSGGFARSTTRSLSARDAIEWVVDQFAIDLRSQRQFLEMLSASIQGIPPDRPVYLTWIAILCALRRKTPDVFRDLAVACEKGDKQGFQRAWTAALPEEDASKRPVRVISRGAREVREREIALQDVAGTYYKACVTELRKIEELIDNASPTEYPATLLKEIATELPNPYNPTLTYYSSAKDYFSLVRHAGHLAERTLPT